jgi:ankyrin repeat protein
MFASSINFSNSLYPSALHMAAANGHLAIVDYLIKNGAVCTLFCCTFYIFFLENIYNIAYLCYNKHIKNVIIRLE